jgi:cell division protein FtsX
VEWLIARVHAWADYASVSGVVISLIGFGGTMFGLFRARSAARQVETAVSSLRENLSAKTAADELARVLHDIEELRSLHRFAAWDILPPRYAFIRRSILAIKHRYPSMTRLQKSALQGIAQQFSAIEDTVERAVNAKQLPDNVSELNRTVSEQGDRLSAIHSAVQGKIGVIR